LPLAGTWSDTSSKSARLAKDFESCETVSLGMARPESGMRSKHGFELLQNLFARLLCLCSPAGQEEYFMAVGVPVASRTASPPKLDEASQAALKAKAEALASQYRTEFLHPPA
jgi:hypothetical protein